ncbi:hypothetical protein ABID65_006711 [Bradyrhizobium sp. S3.9.2]|uniref:hypothetical protein n=1 Tax=Bradyrhizobium sp. S3.9.2 TaxID=3156432 RepID=UPI003391FC4C
MTISPISFPTYQVNSGVDPSMWSSLGNLGKIYQQGQQDRLKQSTLAALGPDAARNANLLIGSGHPDLATMGLNMQTHLQDQAREDRRYDITDQRANRALTIQENQERRAQETFDEDTPEGRAKKVVAAKIDPNLPAAKEFILTGKMPPPRDPTFAETVEQRKQQAIANGLAEGSPGYQSYVLTGKMPREDAQPLSATDKKFIEAADEQVVNLNGVVASLHRAKALSPKAYEGPTAGARGYFTSFLGKDSEFGKGGIATENLHNEVLANALSQLKSIFGAAPTEGERKILLELQGSVNKSDAVRQDIYDRAIGMANIKLNAAQQRANELRGGTYYKPGGGSSTTGPVAGPGVVKTPSFTIE